MANGENCAKGIAKDNEDQLGALGLVVNIIVLWNTIYIEAILAGLRSEGYPVQDAELLRGT